MIELFDNKTGKFIGTDAQYEALPDDQKPKFLAVAEAAQASEAANVEVHDADLALTEAIKNHAAAKATRDRLMPPLTPTAAVKAWIERQHETAAAQR